MTFPSNRFALGEPGPEFDPMKFGEQTHAKRLIRGKHKPNLAHWRISRDGPRPYPWRVLEPFQLVDTFLPPPACFTTFESACAYVAHKVNDALLAAPFLHKAPPQPIEPIPDRWTTP